MGFIIGGLEHKQLTVVRGEIKLIRHIFHLGLHGSYIDLKLSAYRNTRLFVSTLCQDFCQHETCMYLQTCPVRSLRAAKSISTACR